MVDALLSLTYQDMSEDDAKRLLENGLRVLFYRDCKALDTVSADTRNKGLTHRFKLPR